MALAGSDARRSLAGALAALEEGARTHLVAELAECDVILRRVEEGVVVEVASPARITQTDVVSFGRDGWSYLGERRFRRTFEPHDDLARVAGEVAGFVADRVGDDPGAFGPPPPTPPARAAEPRARAPGAARSPSARSGAAARPAAPPKPKGPEERVCPQCFLRRPVEQFTVAGICRDCAEG